jgi:hypothetical protein
LASGVQLSLPTAAAMRADVRHKRDAMRARYVASERHTIQVDYIPYCDELADMIGCKPDVAALAQTDSEVCPPAHVRRPLGGVLIPSFTTAGRGRMEQRCGAVAVPPGRAGRLARRACGGPGRRVAAAQEPGAPAVHGACAALKSVCVCVCVAMHAWFSER